MKAKALRAKSLLLAVFALLVIFSTVSIAQGATHKYSVPYSEIVNSVTTIDFPDDYNYTLPFRYEVTPSATWNSSETTPQFDIRVRNMGVDANGVIWLNFKNDSECYVYADTDANPPLVGSVTWAWDNEVKVKASSTGIKVSSESSGDRLEYNFNMFNITDWSHYSEDDFPLASGFIQVDFYSGTEYGMDIISELLPVVVFMAMLGIVLKFVSRLGKGF